MLLAGRRHIERRATELALLILLAGLLDLAAGTGLAYVAGFEAIADTLTSVNWTWITVVSESLCISFGGYYVAYRVIYGEYPMPGRTLFAVVVAGYGGFFAHGGRTPDDLALRGAGARPRDAIVRVSALGGLEQGVLAAFGCVAAVVVLAGHVPGPPSDATLPWAIVPVPAAIVVSWLAARYRSRWRGKVSMLGDAVLLTRRLLTSGAAAGMAVYWAGEMMASWAALAAFGYRMNGAVLVIAFCTGMVFTRRIAPLTGAGVLTLILPAAFYYCGAPLPVAVGGMFAYRALSMWLPMSVALACLPVLRRISEQAFA